MWPLCCFSIVFLPPQPRGKTPEMPALPDNGCSKKNARCVPLKIPGSSPDNVSLSTNLVKRRTDVPHLLGIEDESGGIMQAKPRERQPNKRNLQAIAPKKSQTSQSSLKGSIDDDPEWDPLGYEEDLMWNLPDPIRLIQLKQYHQSYEYYQSQFPSEDGQFDDVVSGTEMTLRQ